MTRNKGLGLLLAGLAAYGAYRFSKMSPQQRNDLKERGKKLVNDNLGGLGNIFGRKHAATEANAYNNHP